MNPCLHVLSHKNGSLSLCARFKNHFYLLTLWSAMVFIRLFVQRSNNLMNFLIWWKVQKHLTNSSYIYSLQAMFVACCAYTCLSCEQCIERPFRPIHSYPDQTWPNFQMLFLSIKQRPLNQITAIHHEQINGIYEIAAVLVHFAWLIISLNRSICTASQHRLMCQCLFDVIFLHQTNSTG